MTKQSETQERLKQIRERNKERKQAFAIWKERGIVIESLPIPDMITDIDELLSLIDARTPVDNQGAGGELGLFEDCRQGNHQECMFQWPHPSGSVNENQQPYLMTCACPCHSQIDAATQMRDACVVELKGLLEHEVNGHNRGALNRAIARLESLTLDQVKQ